MKLAQSFDKLQRFLSRQWTAGGRQGEFSYNEYEYLKTVEAAEQEDPDDHGNHGEGPHLSDVALEMQVRKASASVMVKKLEKRGLIERVQCRYDARAQHILLTTEGRRLLTKEQAIYERIAASLESHLNEKERQMLQQLLGKLCSKL